MKEMNLPETQLRSWQLRRPSARLKQRIFSAAARRLEFTWAARWLVPATACALLALATLNQQSGLPHRSSSSEAAIAAIMSNQSPVTDLVGDRQSARNTFSSVTFDWTNRSGFTSSIAPFLPDRMH